MVDHLIRWFFVCPHNFTARETIDTLQIPTKLHLNPYLFTWTNSPTAFVMYRCLVPLKMSSYEAYVWCDVIPMNITHIRLGQPRLYEYNVKRDKEAHAYTIPNVRGGPKVTLLSLRPIPSSSTAMSASTNYVHAKVTIGVTESAKETTNATTELKNYTSSIENASEK